MSCVKNNVSRGVILADVPAAGTKFPENFFGSAPISARYPAFPARRPTTLRKLPSRPTLHFRDIIFVTVDSVEGAHVARLPRFRSQFRRIKLSRYPATTTGQLSATYEKFPW